MRKENKKSKESGSFRQRGEKQLHKSFIRSASIPGLWKKLAVVFVFSVIVLLLFEVTKSWILTNLTIWESHFITIIVLSIVATISSYYLNKKQEDMLLSLSMENDERILSEKALMESEEKLRSIMENSPDAIFMINPQGKYIYTNKAVTTMLGYTSDEMKEKTIADISPPDKLDEYFEIFKRVLVEGKTFAEIELLKNDGNYISTDLNTVLLPDGMVYGSCRDISERKQTELEQKIMFEITNGLTTNSNQNELLWLIHHSVKKAIYAENFFIALYDENTGLFSFPYFEDKFDQPPSPTAMSKSCTAYVYRSGKPLQLTEDSFQQLVEQNEVELVGYHSPSWVGVPLKTHSKTIGVLVLQHYEKDNVYSEKDVNFLATIGNQIAIVLEIKIAEQALRESETKLNVILQSTADGILAADGNGKVIKTNERFAQLWNIPTSLINSGDDNALLDFVLFQLIDPNEFISKVKKLYNSTDEDLDQLHFKDGRIFERFSSPLLMPDSSLGRVWSFRDITEQKRAELEIKERNEQLIKLNAEKDKFFSIIAHDLKGPFNGFLNLTELMADSTELFSPAEYIEYSKMLNEAARNLYKLLENLLEWAQVQKGAIDFTPKDSDLSKMVSQSIDTIFQRALQKKISIINEIIDTQKVYADEKMIGTVLRNLLSNAIKFTRTDGRAIIKSKWLDNDTIEVSVEDNGVGISEKDVNKLFKIEEKVSSKGTDGESSTGLGLLLCKEFIEMHGGKIWVESELGKGSKFKFTLHKSILTS